MLLELLRRSYTDNATEGDLYIDGEFFCYTLEDTVREGPKVYGKTAIPEGRYRVTVTYSPKFKRRLPLLHDVPNYTGIRMHRGNSAKDTLGCPLVGDDPTTLRDNWVGESRPAEERLTALLEATLDSGEEVWIEVHNATQAAA